MCAALYLILHPPPPTFGTARMEMASPWIDIGQVNKECQVLRYEVGTRPSLVNGLLSTTVMYKYVFEALSARDYSIKMLETQRREVDWTVVYLSRINAINMLQAAMLFIRILVIYI